MALRLALATAAALVLLLAFLQVAAANCVASCPAQVRLINQGDPSNPLDFDLQVDGKTVIRNVNFRNASTYVSVRPGNREVCARESATRRRVGCRTFFVVGGMAYSFVPTGTSAVAATGTLLYRSTPFVFPEEIAPPNQGKFRGRLYTVWENVNMEFDLLIEDSASPGNELVRLPSVAGKNAVAFPELVPSTYNFRAVNPGTNTTLTTQTGSGAVTLEALAVSCPPNSFIDILATGSPINSVPNPPQIAAIAFTSELENGCFVADGQSARHYNAAAPAAGVGLGLGLAAALLAAVL